MAKHRKDDELAPLSQVLPIVIPLAAVIVGVFIYKFVTHKPARPPHTTQQPALPPPPPLR